jgi:hypothetical protein
MTTSMTPKAGAALPIVERLRLVRGHTYLADAEAMCDEAAALIEELVEALTGIIREFEKFSRYGSPIAMQANEAVNYARALLAKLEAGDTAP